MPLRSNDDSTTVKWQPDTRLIRVFFPLFHEVQSAVLAFLRKHNGNPNSNNTYVRGALTDPRLIWSTPACDEMTVSKIKEQGMLLQRELNVIASKYVSVASYRHLHADIKFNHN